MLSFVISEQSTVYMQPIIGCTPDIAAAMANSSAPNKLFLLARQIAGILCFAQKDTKSGILALLKPK